jgi:hypothetical protein
LAEAGATLFAVDMAGTAPASGATATPEVNWCGELREFGRAGRRRFRPASSPAYRLSGGSLTFHKLRVRT